jgi:hypothetical protein
MIQKASYLVNPGDCARALVLTNNVGLAYHLFIPVHQENLKFYEVQGAVMRVLDGLSWSMLVFKIHRDTINVYNSH